MPFKQGDHARVVNNQNAGGVLFHLYPIGAEVVILRVESRGTYKVYACSLIDNTSFVQTLYEKHLQPLYLDAWNRAMQIV